jgi:hypothetical protein
MYFPSFLCKFSKGEEAVKAGGGVRCTTSNGTLAHTLILFTLWIDQARKIAGELSRKVHFKSFCLCHARVSFCKEKESSR